ncbi:hypothetical protein OTB20_41250 [Streptomyces sp. H27-H1]|uniref:hypothetical protein n=1 Tax=Streptomyces sp. H27-H1 TaxID=2996461 RepID=UPI0022703D29|nr:hypothetical protein [Streptomyces sp. H27-H1]MCY0932459.1 hypothetical protein [Streptomyces sp. H27-H1]
MTIADDDRAHEVEKQLMRRDWVPTDDEKVLGAEILSGLRLLRAEVGTTLDQWGAPLPRDTAEALIVEIVMMTRIETELLPAWRQRLEGSPMLALIDVYLDCARVLQPYAQALRPLTEPGNEGLTEAYFIGHEADGKLRRLWATLGSVQAIIHAAVTGDSGH